jgi:hypothetical protein
MQIESAALYELGGSSRPPTHLPADRGETRRRIDVCKTEIVEAIETEAKAIEAREKLSHYARCYAVQIAADIASTRRDLARAAAKNAQVSKRAAEIAQMKSESLDSQSTEEDMRPIAASVELANRASILGMQMLANTQDVDGNDGKPLTLEDLVSRANQPTIGNSNG